MVRNHRRWIAIGAWVSCFVIGSFVWKIMHTGKFLRDENHGNVSVDDIGLSVYVGDQLITRDDIEWEYRFYLEQLNNLAGTEQRVLAEAQPKQGEARQKGNNEDKPLVELYDKIMADLIERKLLFQFIGRDSRFSLDEPGRYTSCIQEWQKVLVRHAQFFQTDEAREQLKAMICEKDILQQYLEERIMGSIRIEEADLREYYKEHKGDFTEPARVVVRQIVTASEEEAKRVRARVTPQNFASLARELSIAPEAVEGGQLGPFARGEMPSFFDIAFEMQVGEIQGTIKSTYGFHIILLERKFPRVHLSFEAARERIEQALGNKRQEEEYKKWVEMALNSIPIRSSRGF